MGQLGIEKDSGGKNFGINIIRFCRVIGQIQNDIVACAFFDIKNDKKISSNIV
jgi:hypothetical protein